MIPIGSYRTDQKQMSIREFRQNFQQDFLILLVINAGNTENDFLIFRNFVLFSEISLFRQFPVQNPIRKKFNLFLRITFPEFLGFFSA